MLANVNNAHLKDADSSRDTVPAPGRLDVVVAVGGDGEATDLDETMVGTGDAAADQPPVDGPGLRCPGHPAHRACCLLMREGHHQINRSPPWLALVVWFIWGSLNSSPFCT